MLNNSFKTACRQLLRHRSYTIINIAGLAAGIAVCLLIFVYIRFETSYDDFHSKKDRIYRIMTEYHHTDGVFAMQAVPAPLPTTIRHDFPQLTTSGVYASKDVQVLVMGLNGEVEKKFKEPAGVFSVEPAFFSIFDFPWLEGSPAAALGNPNSAVLTKETAERYFGDWKSAVGRTIKINDHYLLTVTGILAPIPANTDFQLKVVTPYALLGFQLSTDWVSTEMVHACYALLPSGMSAATLDRQLRSFAKKYEPADDKDELTLGPLSAVHTYSKNWFNFAGRCVRPDVIRALWLIGAFILLIACVNFINLSTANSVNRAREVGVRKVLGGNRGQLRRQFLLETLIIVACAVLLALTLASLVLPAVAKIVDLPLSAALLASPVVVIYLLSLTLVVTVLAGWYPSLVLSRFNPSEALRSKLAARIAKGVTLRRSLVVLQFVIAQALIIGTLVMIRQMDLFKNGSMGFDQNAVISVPFPTDSAALTKLDYVRNELSAIKGINRVSFNSKVPADPGDNWSTVTYDHAAKQTDWFSIVKFIDSNYLGTYRIPLVAGTNFRSNDSIAEFLVTESFVRQLGIKHPQEVINKDLNLWGSIKGPIVGVMKDFNAASLKDGIIPVMLTKLKPAWSNAGIKLTGNDVPGTLAAIGKVWNKAYPNFVFEYSFLDQRIANFYKEERELSQLYQYFAAIAIFLSCLGLYGLASFMAVQRIKEIGIRKVLGASVQGIIVLFSREFVILTGIAYLIAAPLAGWYMHSWLQNFVCRASLTWSIFAIGGILSVLVALVTVSARAMRAANSNPVQALKTE